MKFIKSAILLLFSVQCAITSLSGQSSDTLRFDQDSIVKLSAKDRLTAMRSRDHIQFPLISYNAYDGLQLGGVFSNYLSNRSGFKYTVAPMYAFASKRPVGSASLAYNLVKDADATYDRLRFGLEARHYSYDRDTTYDTRDQFYKIAPEVALFKNVDKDDTTIRHRLSYRFIHIWQRYTRGIDFMTLEFERKNRSYYVNELRYEQVNLHEFNPSQTILLLHQGRNFVKLFGYREQSFIYQEKRRVRLRLSFTYLPQNNTDSDDATVRPTLSGQHGSGFFQPDYTHDQNLIGRNKKDGLWSQQGYKKGAGLNTIAFGNAPDKWVVGFGGDVDLPLPLKVNLYFDAGLYKPAPSFADASKLTLSYSGGLALPILGDYFQIFVPILESTDIKDNHDLNGRNFWEKITFTLRLKNLDRLVDKYYN